MPSLANLMEDYRNWRGRQDWEQGKGWQDFFAGDPRAQEQFEKLSGFGTDAGGLVGMIKASHGSPHMFDKFDFTKIGSGEGNQSYGHGGYFAQGFDSPVAKEYRDQLAADVQFKGQPFYSGKTGKQMATTGNQELDDYLLANLGDVSAARSNLLADLRDVRSVGGDVKDYQKTLADLRNMRGDVESGNTGHLYNVELKWPNAAREEADPLGEHHLLDWYEPLSKQSESVKQAMRDYATLSGKEHYVQPETQLPVYIDEGISPDTTGKQFYDWLASHSRDIKGVASRQNASSDLKAFGIPGIKYFDEGSRAAKKGTRNYVMFDDRFPEIVSRNGVSLSDLLRR